MTDEEKRKMVEDIISGDQDEIPAELSEEDRHEMIRNAARKILERIGHDRP